MKLFRGLKTAPVIAKGTVATIGNFDGVHRGHQALLTQLLIEAKARKLPVVLILFEPQPNEFFYQEDSPVRLSSLRDKITLVSNYQVDYVFCLKFDEKLATMAAAAFARHFFSLLEVKYLLVGEDFRFGFQRRGNIDLLKSIGQENHCHVESFPDFYLEGERVSSTNIRRALKENDFDRASKLLGRPFSLCGRVIRGEGRGRKWGIPTANLSLFQPTLPIGGVFCVEVFCQERDLTFYGVANIGTRPTVNGLKNRLEVHLLDCNENLYGKILQVFFLKKLREEIKFKSIEELIDQINHDICAAKCFFSQELIGFQV